MLLIERSDADSPELQFVYNPLGQRILKITRTRSGGDYTDPDEWKYTYYAYDANGAVMGTYDIQILEEDYKVEIAELNIYGMGRIGVIEPERVLYDDVDPLDDEGYGADGIFWNELGSKKYELTNYLGNVNAVVTDRKMVSGGASVYEAVVILKADYYPFGMTMPGREYQTDAYRYAYNGMEQDPEMKGNGNSYTTEFRQFDPRLGRWMSLDPLTGSSPHMSPYNAFNDNPIFFTDPSGLIGEPVRTNFVSIPKQLDEPKQTSVYFTPGELHFDPSQFPDESREAWNSSRGKMANQEISPSKFLSTQVGSWSIQGAIPFYDPEKMFNAKVGDDNMYKEAYGGGLKSVVRKRLKGERGRSPKQRTTYSSTMGSPGPNGTPGAGPGAFSAPAQGMAAGLLVLQAAIWIKQQITFWENAAVDGRVKNDTYLASDVLYDLNICLNRGWIPLEFKNEISLTVIANIMLNGSFNAKLTFADSRFKQYRKKRFTEEKVLAKDLLRLLDSEAVVVHAHSLKLFKTVTVDQDNLNPNKFNPIFQYSGEYLYAIGYLKMIHEF